MARSKVSLFPIYPLRTVGVPDRASVLYNQAGDYIFYAQADADGKFTLPAVRPGTTGVQALTLDEAVTDAFSDPYPAP